MKNFGDTEAQNLPPDNTKSITDSTPDGQIPNPQEVHPEQPDIQKGK